MKLSYIDLCGFRSYRRQTRVDFASGFTIIDGRNGAGKSTLFDAVEYALTGSIHKYPGSSKSETVNDYVWWTGEGEAPAERYVEVGFVGDDGTPFSIRRTEAAGAPSADEEALARALTYPERAPDDPLRQLCRVSLIRDEYIAEFSLDLKEADRYAHVRQALGATDSDEWTARGAEVEKLAKAGKAAADADLDRLRQSRDDVQRRIDEAVQNRRPDDALREAAERLRAFAEIGPVSDDEAASAARERIGELGGRTAALRRLAEQWAGADRTRDRLPELDAAAAAARTAYVQAQQTVEQLPPPQGPTASKAADLARDLARLVDLGRRVGLRGDACPLCGCSRNEEAFERGLQAAQAAARDYDAAAAAAAGDEQARAAAEAHLVSAAEALQAAEQAAQSARDALETFEADKERLGLPPDADANALRALVAELEERSARAATDLRTLGTRDYDVVLAREERRAEALDAQIKEAERAAGRARKAAAAAKALHAAANRAALETLEARFRRVQPVMTDLYQRLNPHPVWKDFDSVIRGKVKGYMRFQVGGEHNPQFIFSSGQRRATGLAFLLAVNLSLAWSKWKTIMLDDPVQHVDDFRAVHLAEVVGQFVREGRQIICAVEDAALADLLTRRLPNERLGAAQRLTLTLEPDGSSTAAPPRLIPPLPRHTITNGPRLSLAG